jgi:hypothetical protein
MQWIAMRRRLGAQLPTGERWIGVVSLACTIFVVFEVEKMIKEHRPAHDVTSGDLVIGLDGSSIAAQYAPVLSQ